MSSFNISDFRRRVDNALVSVKTIIENNRQPKLASEVQHEYDDKYLLAQFLANTGLVLLCFGFGFGVVAAIFLLVCLSFIVFLPSPLSSPAIVGYLNVFEQLGLTKEQLSQLQSAAKSRSVTLRLKSEEACKFLRKTERDVESPTTHVSLLFVLFACFPFPLYPSPFLRCSLPTPPFSLFLFPFSVFLFPPGEHLHGHQVDEQSCDEGDRVVLAV
jgi:hypothetical protein